MKKYQLSVGAAIQMCTCFDGYNLRLYIIYNVLISVVN